MMMNTYQPREFQQQQQQQQQQQPRLNGGNNNYNNRRNNRHHQQTKNDQVKDMNGIQQPAMCNGSGVPGMDEPIEQLSQMSLGKQDSAPITA